MLNNEQCLYKRKWYHVYEFCSECFARFDKHDLNCLECCPVKIGNVTDRLYQKIPVWVKEGNPFLIWDADEECFYKAVFTEVDFENEVALYRDTDDASEFKHIDFDISFDELNNPKLAKEIIE